MTLLIGQAIEKLFGPDVPLRFTAYDGSSGGQTADADVHLHLRQRARAALHRHRARAASAWPGPMCRATSSSRALTRATSTSC